MRTLLLAEDAGFYGHRGIDLRELPAALLTNWSRGGAAEHRQSPSSWPRTCSCRATSSSDASCRRRSTFLLESALGKDRILEIYLNIIEWGPDLRGLRPAAPPLFRSRTPRADAGRDGLPGSDHPRADQGQSSFAHGTPGPGLRLLIDELLAKLRVGGCDRRGGNIGERSENPSSLPAARRPDDCWRMETGGRGSTKSPSSSVQAVSHYRTPVGVTSGLILFRLVGRWRVSRQEDAHC